LGKTKIIKETKIIEITHKFPDQIVHNETMKEVFLFFILNVI